MSNGANKPVGSAPVLSDSETAANEPSQRTAPALSSIPSSDEKSKADRVGTAEASKTGASAPAQVRGYLLGFWDWLNAPLKA